MNTARDRSDARGLLIGVILAAGVAAIFGQAAGHGFAALDDAQYVTGNPLVRNGINASSVLQAFAPGYASNWHPLTWLSLMLDVEWFGLRPGPMHVVNVLLHAANAVLAFLVLRVLLRALVGAAAENRVWALDGAAFLGAAFWAWHPLRVEAVAWISQRKELLAAFFGLLTVWLYIRAWRTGEPRDAREPVGRPAGLPVCEGLVPVVFLLALMSKQTVVMLPAVLAAVEWMLWRRVPWQRLLPLFLLSLGVGGLTIWAQSHGGAVREFAVIPFWARVVNAGESLGAYLRQTCWPAGLSVFYPFHPFQLHEIIAAAVIWLSLAVLAAAGMAARPQRAIRRIGAVGACWFLVSLLPMLGLLQVGGQARADRYTYWPSLGLSLLAAGLVGAAAFWRTGGLPAIVGRAVGPLAALVLLAISLCACRQTACWASTTTLFTQALHVTDDNFVAHYFLGQEARAQGDEALARRHLDAAARRAPTMGKGTREREQP